MGEGEGEAGAPGHWRGAGRGGARDVWCLRLGEERSRQHSAQACLLDGGVPVLGCRAYLLGRSLCREPLIS